MWHTLKSIIKTCHTLKHIFETSHTLKYIIESWHTLKYIIETSHTLQSLSEIRHKRSYLWLKHGTQQVYYWNLVPFQFGGNTDRKQVSCIDIKYRIMLVYVVKTYKGDSRYCVCMLSLMAKVRALRWQNTYFSHSKLFTSDSCIKMVWYI